MILICFCIFITLRCLVCLCLSCRWQLVVVGKITGPSSLLSAEKHHFPPFLRTCGCSFASYDLHFLPSASSSFYPQTKGVSPSGTHLLPQEPSLWILQHMILGHFMKRKNIMDLQAGACNAVPREVLHLWTEEQSCLSPVSTGESQICLSRCTLMSMTWSPVSNRNSQEA